MGRQLYACHFTAPPPAIQGDHWPRLARVLAYTAGVHCPDWTMTVETLAAPPVCAPPVNYAANTHKLDRWCQAILNAPDGTEYLLIDADTAILRPLDDVWSQPFDLVYTVKPPKSRHPFNAGVIFLQVSARTKDFLTRWRDLNRRFFRVPRELQPWRRRHGGINQSALGCLLRSPAVTDLTIRELPCLEWNCEDDAWSSFDPTLTRILHVKSALRRAVFASPNQTPRSLLALVQHWRQLEQEALRDRQAVAS